MDRGGNVLAPMPVQAVNTSEFEMIPESLKLLKKVRREVGINLTGSYFNYDSGVDSKAVRAMIWNSGMIPNIPENPRNRDVSKPKRGRPRAFNKEIYHDRFSIERSFAWEDTYRQLVISYERKAEHQLGTKLLGYALINLRHFLGQSKGG